MSKRTSPPLESIGLKLEVRANKVDKSKICRDEQKNYYTSFTYCMIRTKAGWLGGGRRPQDDARMRAVALVQGDAAAGHPALRLAQLLSAQRVALVHSLDLRASWVACTMAIAW